MKAMKQLTLNSVLEALAVHLDAVQRGQITNSTHPQCGGLVHPDCGIADAIYSAHFVVGCAYLAMGTGDESRLARAAQAADFMLQAQRPSGNIDLLSANYDSAPDTGFVVQHLCAVLELARDRGVDSPAWRALLERLERFVRRAVVGMLTGGFHTPNHRWVITAALVQAHALFPDLAVAATVDAYLAEGIDVDAEGLFIERSIGVYDAVNDRSWLLIAERRASVAALDAVARNLDLDLHFLHGDGTAETGLSRRQDHGTRTVPLGLTDCYLLYNALRPNPLYVQAAQMLWANSDAATGHLLWLIYPLLKYGNPAPAEAALPDDFTVFLPINGIWRARRGLSSASAFRNTTRLFSLVYGKAELSCVKISQTYFGHSTGCFIGDDMTATDGGVILRSEGRSNPRRPGYELPLGYPVPPERWAVMREERGLRGLPPALSTLTIREVDGGFDLRYQTLDGLGGVAAQVAFDFTPGGVWETDDTATRTQAGQVFFLKQRYGAMRYGHDVIRIGPGAYAHGMWAMRDAELAPDHVRVLLTFLTPVDVTLQIRAQVKP